MLKLMVLVGFLASGCMCVEKFTIQSTKEFEDTSTDVFFPTFKVYPENFPSDFAWRVHRVPYNGLEFQANLNLEKHLDENLYTPHFSSPEGDLILRSVKFQFPDDGNYRVIIRVQTNNGKREWIVESKVCLPPTTEDAEAHAFSKKPCKAVRANTLTPKLAKYLREQETNASGFKEASFGIQWAVDVLFENNPRAPAKPSSSGGPTRFIGVPVIVPFKVLLALNGVRVEM